MKNFKRLIVFLVIAAIFGSVAYYVGIWFFVTQPLFFIGKTGSAVLVDASQIETHVRTLSEVCAPRDYTHPENLDCAADYIHAHFAQSCGRVTEQIYDVDGSTYRNVSVQFGSQTGERIIVGAHYDVFGPYPGANDDASGIAALLELADLLSDTELPFTVELVAFTLEEPPFFGTDQMGSAVHAAALKEQGVDVKAMLALDEIGYYSDEPGSQSLPIYPWLKRFYSSKADFIAVLGPLDTGWLTRKVKAAMQQASDLPVYSFNAPVEMERRVILGDHRNYVAQGYSAIIITDTAFLRSNIKHTEADTTDTLDYGRIAKVIRGIYEAILTLAR